MWAATVLCVGPWHQEGGVELKMRMAGPEMGLCSMQLIHDSVKLLQRRHEGQDM